MKMSVREFMAWVEKDDLCHFGIDARDDPPSARRLCQVLVALINLPCMTRTGVALLKELILATEERYWVLEKRGGEIATITSVEKEVS